MAEPWSAEPQKMALVNLATGQVFYAQYNPEEIEETVGANWSKLAPLGLSHQVKQFSNTEDLATSFTLMWSAASGPIAQAVILEARKFIMSLCYPVRSAGSIATAGPPRVLFVWPGLYSLTCVVKTAKFNHKSFNLNGVPIVFSCALAIEEIRDGLVTSEDVLEYGTERGSEAIGGTMVSR